MKQSLSNQISDYLADRTAKLSPATIFQYSNVLGGQFLPWATGAGITEAQQVDAKAMDAFVAHLKARGHTGRANKPLSPTTLRTYVRAIRSFLNDAEIPKGRFVQPSKPRRIVRDVLTENEIKRMENVCSQERDRLIIRVLADTGVRSGELLSMRWDGMKDRDRTIGVFGKTGGRNVVVPERLYRRLKTFAEQNQTERIFTSKTGTDLTPNGINQFIHNTAIKAKIGRRVHSHLFRHSFITQAIIDGIDLVSIQRQVGHESLAQISQTYASIQPADSYAAFNKAFNR